MDSFDLAGRTLLCPIRHRYAGWSSIALLWVFIILNDSYDPNGERYDVRGGHFYSRFQFFAAFFVTFLVVLPWLCVRKVNHPICRSYFLKKYTMAPGGVYHSGVPFAGPPSLSPLAAVTCVVVVMHATVLAAHCTADYPNLGLQPWAAAVSLSLKRSCVPFLKGGAMHDCGGFTPLSELSVTPPFVSPFRLVPQSSLLATNVDSSTLWHSADIDGVQALVPCASGPTGFLCCMQIQVELTSVSSHV